MSRQMQNESLIDKEHGPRNIQGDLMHTTGKESQTYTQGETSTYGSKRRSELFSSPALCEALEDMISCQSRLHNQGSPI